MKATSCRAKNKALGLAGNFDWLSVQFDTNHNQILGGHCGILCNASRFTSPH